MGAAASAQQQEGEPPREGGGYESKFGGQGFNRRGRPQVKWDHEGALRVSKPDSGFGRITSYKGGAVTIELLPEGARADVSAGTDEEEGAARESKASEPRTQRQQSQPIETTLGSGVGAEELSKLPIRILKKELALRGVDCSGCVEKAHLVSKLLGAVHAEDNDNDNDSDSDND